MNQWTDLQTAVSKARRLEGTTGKAFTFLTTNAGAAALNQEWFRQAFPAAAAKLAAQEGLPGDPAYGDQLLCFEVGMRVRLTQNLDKDRGFVNGAIGTIHRVLRKDVFVLKTDAGVLLLVHPVKQNGRAFMPVTYGYATTIRKAQGAILELVGIRFDRRLADHGYAYVAASRARRRQDVYHIGSVRRTDWRPVGEDDRGLGTAELSAWSLSDSQQPESEDPSTDISDQVPSSDDFPDVSMDTDGANEPEDRSEDESQEMDMDHQSEEEDASRHPRIDDSSGLFS